MDKFVAAAQKLKLVDEVLSNIDDVAKLISAFTTDETKQALVQSVIDNIDDIKEVMATSSDIDTIASDLIKGNYLGNRKIDIDLSLNKSTTDAKVSYSQVNIVLTSGIRYEIPFLVGNSVLELTSHSDIRDYIVNHSLWQNIMYTECTFEEATTTTNALIRFRDADGHSSNIDRVELYVYSGAANNVKPSYWWADTTSALQTIANRIGDIIALGNDIDNIVVLSQRIDDLVILQENINEVLSAGTHALNAQSYANASLLSSQSSATSASQAEAQALIATQKAEVVQAFANIEWVGFDLEDGELTVSIIDGSASTPVLIDGEFIINYN